MKYTNKLLVINLIFLLITYCWLHYIFDYQTSKLEIVFAMTLTFLSSFIIGEKRKVFANNEMCDIDMLNTAYYLFYGLVFIAFGIANLLGPTFFFIIKRYLKVTSFVPFHYAYLIGGCCQLVSFIICFFAPKVYEKIIP